MTGHADAVCPICRKLIKLGAEFSMGNCVMIEHSSGQEKCSGSGTYPLECHLETMSYGRNNEHLQGTTEDGLLSGLDMGR